MLVSFEGFVRVPSEEPGKAPLVGALSGPAVGCRDAAGPKNAGQRAYHVGWEHTTNACVCVLVDAVVQVKRRTCGRRRACVRSCRSAWQPVTAGAAQTRRAHGTQATTTTITTTIRTTRTGQARPHCRLTAQRTEATPHAVLGAVLLTWVGHWC